MTAHDWVFAILGIVAWEIAGQITDRILWPAFCKIRDRIMVRRLLRRIRRDQVYHNPPPQHFNCRCVIMPIDKDEA